MGQTYSIFDPPSVNISHLRYRSSATNRIL